MKLQMLKLKRVKHSGEAREKSFTLSTEFSYFTPHRHRTGRQRFRLIVAHPTARDELLDEQANLCLHWGTRGRVI